MSSKPTISTILKINTIMAVLRIPNIIIEDIQDCLPTLWPQLFSVLLDRLSQKGHISPSTFSKISTLLSGSKTGLDGIQNVIDALEIMTGTTLDHLDAPSILHKQKENVDDLIDLLWEVFKICEHGIQGGENPHPLDDSVQSSSKQVEPNVSSSSSKISGSFKTRSKSGASLQISEQEIQDWGLGPIRTPLSPRKRSSSPLLKSKKRTRFSVRDMKSMLHSDFTPQTMSYNIESQALSSKLTRKNVRSSASIKRKDVVDDIRTLHANIRSGKQVEIDAKWVDEVSRFEQYQSEPDYLYRSTQKYDENMYGLDDVEEYLSEIEKESKTSFELDAFDHSKPNQSYQPPCQTEKNLEFFLDRVIPAKLPLLENPPFKKSEKERAWKLQLDLSKRALDDRIWRQKVLMQKEMDKLSRTTPLDSLVKDLNTKARQNRANQEKEMVRDVSRQLKERHRSLVRLSNHMHQIQSQANSQLEKQKYVEEGLKSGLVEEYMKAQRQLIIDERRMAFEEAKARDSQLQSLEAKRQAKLQDKVAYLRSQLQEAEAEEKLLKKGQQEILRSLIRESKNIQKMGIQKVKTRLEHERWKVDTFRQDDRQFNTSIQFKTKPKH